MAGMSATRLTEQERGDWANHYPEDGEPCPDCHHGILEVQSFGAFHCREIHANCCGINGVTLDDSDDEDEEGAGCGWSGIYKIDESREES
jgi:hypothetical protein